MLFDEMEVDEDDLFDDEDSNGVSEVAKPDEMPAPRAQNLLIGHQDIEKQLLDLFSGSRAPHAIIFAGPSGVGKSTMAFRLARYLLKKSEDEANEGMFGGNMFGDVAPPPTSLFVDSKDQVFSKVAAGGHPDLLTVERVYDEKKDRRKAELGVEEARKIGPFMRKTPAIENGWRIVIVDDADLMNRNSQNAILKILEEPPEKSLLVLITHRLGALLPTILSRASVLNFYPLAEEALTTVLAKINPRLLQEEKDLFIGMAEGSIGRLALYADPKNSPTISEVISFLASWPKFDWTRIQHFSETVGRGATHEIQQSFQDALLWVSSSILKAKAEEKPLPHTLSALQTLYYEVPLARWLQICDTLREHFTRVHSGNLDKRFLVMGAFMVFENNV